jgi:4-amino-4-deoxy-L-arabinose transferase-like glycosyltransferase
MRLARSASPALLLERLFQIDATRAPLHPLLLQAWLKIFGTSEAAARSLSVVCGVATVVLIFYLGQLAFDLETGLWAAWLAAVSPALVVYAREARMYAVLVLVTCCCWLSLFASSSGPTIGRIASYVTAVTALAYSHPLGLVMLGTLALAGLLAAKTCFGTRMRWLLAHLIVLALILPWLRSYVDHPPESTSGRLALRYLLGTPIGFTGGNSALLLGLVLLIAIGVTGRLTGDRSGSLALALERRWLGPVCLLLWLIVPPSLLYFYSMIGHPVFGPQRYTVFVAPAFLVLVAAGLAWLPAMVRYPAALGLTVISALALGSAAYDPELKADWRAFAAAIASQAPESTVVIVASTDPAHNVEVETARYYLPASCKVSGTADATLERIESTDADAVFLAAGARRGRLLAEIPDSIGPYHFREYQRYAGLVVYRAIRGR